MNSKDILKDGITIKTVYKNFKDSVKKRNSPFDYAQLIKQDFPELVQKVIDSANDALEDIWLLPGYPKKRFIGNPPLWHDNPFNNNEYIFQISRMLHWLPMMQAYLLTKEEKYAKKIIDECLDWIDECPRPELCDENGRGRIEIFNFPPSKEWRVLECGIRPYKVWIPALEILVYSDLLTVDIFEKILHSLVEQCEVIEKITPMAWPLADHNHFLMECLGLLSVSFSFPELKKSEEWQRYGVDGFNRAITAQVLESGAQIEGCPSYHNGCIFWFAKALVYEKKYGFKLSDTYKEYFAKMVEHSVYATRPNATNIPWGDTSTVSGLLVNGAMCSFMGNNNIESLKYARHFFDYDTFIDAAATEIWKMEDNIPAFCKALKEVKDNKETPNLPTCKWDKQLKHTYMRTSWEKDALSIVFACRTPVQNLHAHIDPNAFDFTAYGRPLVVDPGKYTYQDGEYRTKFKGMSWHNTLMINNQNAWEYIASWKYGDQKDGNVVNSYFAKDFMWTIGKHINYEPSEHTRGIAIIDEKFVVVLDYVSQLKENDKIDIHFHIDSVNVNTKGNTVYSKDADIANVIINSSVKDINIEDAKISDENDTFRNSKIATFTFENKDDGANMSFASIMFPTKENEDPENYIQNVKILEVSENDGIVSANILVNDKKYTVSLNTVNEEMNIKNEKTCRRN